MKKFVLVFIVVCMCLPTFAIISNGATDVSKLWIDLKDEDLIPVTVLTDYRKAGYSGVIYAGTFSAEDMKTIYNQVVPVFNQMLDGWNYDNSQLDSSKRTCTTLIKKLDDGTVVMGRNMDLAASFMPVVIFHTKGNGKNTYDTANIFYSDQNFEVFDQILDTYSLASSKYWQLPVSCCDVLNSEGLIIEMNMRESCEKTVCSGTNPKSYTRVSEITVARYIADHCATIEEALAYVNTLDIYSPKSEIMSWQMALGMVDKTGRYGCMEFVNNEVVWNEGTPGFACGQANFFWDPKAYANQENNIGKGRWYKAMTNYDYIQSNADMENTMKSIWYSKFITSGKALKDCDVNWLDDWITTDENPALTLVNTVIDWRDKYKVKVDEKKLSRAMSIAIQEAKEGIVWNTDFVQSVRAMYDMPIVCDLVCSAFKQLPVEVKKTNGFYEFSGISYVYDNKNKEMVMHLCEQDDTFYLTSSYLKLRRT